MVKKTSKTASAAIVTIRRAPAMTRRGRLAVAKWLRARAADLEAHGHLYANRFTGRYLYGED